MSLNGEACEDIDVKRSRIAKAGPRHYGVIGGMCSVLIDSMGEFLRSRESGVSFSGAGELCIVGKVWILSFPHDASSGVLSA